MQSTKQRLIKRLQWYYQVEGMNVVMFLGILIFLNAQYNIGDLIFLSYGLFLVCFILFQGTYYWWVKLSVLKEKTVRQSKIIQRFRSFKKQNLYLIALIPVILFLQWWVSGKTLGGDNFLFWAVFANVFAIFEHVNYYKRQLMYDNIHDINYLLRHRKLKEASLFKDLRENKL